MAQPRVPTTAWLSAIALCGCNLLGPAVKECPDGDLDCVLQGLEVTELDPDSRQPRAEQPLVEFQTAEVIEAALQRGAASGLPKPVLTSFSSQVLLFKAGAPVEFSMGWDEPNGYQPTTPIRMCARGGSCGGTVMVIPGRRDGRTSGFTRLRLVPRAVPVHDTNFDWQFQPAVPSGSQILTSPDAMLVSDHWVGQLGSVAGLRGSGGSGGGSGAGGGSGGPSCGAGVCAPGQICVSTRNCIRSSINGTCQCGGSASGTCTAASVSPSGTCGTCSSTYSACCPGQTCVNGACSNSLCP